jgi:hypothetical protein
MRLPALALGAALSVGALSTGANAQLHGDLDVEAGASLHVLSSRPVGGDNPSVGPSFNVSGHVAVLPLFRAGLYVSHDFSPLSGADLRESTSAGLSLRLFSPWPVGSVRLWFAAGVGYTAAEAPSYSKTVVSGDKSVPATVSSADGGFVDVPMGLGISFRLSRSVELLAEAGARMGFLFTGDMYHPGPTVVPAGSPGAATLPAAGEDVVTPFVVAGVAFEL